MLPIHLSMQALQNSSIIPTVPVAFLGRSGRVMFLITYRIIILMLSFPVSESQSSLTLELVTLEVTLAFCRRQIHCAQLC